MRGFQAGNKHQGSMNPKKRGKKPSGHGSDHRYGRLSSAVTCPVDHITYKVDRTQRMRVCPACHTALPARGYVEVAA